MRTRPILRYTGLALLLGLLTLTAPKITIENITGDHLLNFDIKKLFAPSGATVK